MYSFPFGVADASSGPEDNLYRNWLDSVAKYRKTLGGQGHPISRFFLILRIKKRRFSEKIEYHKKYPMFVPAEGHGELWGVAISRDEVDKMIAPDPSKPKDPRGEYVYLIYKIKVEGSKDWRALLDFLARRGMLERETS